MTVDDVDQRCRSPRERGTPSVRGRCGVEGGERWVAGVALMAKKGGWWTRRWGARARGRLRGWWRTLCVEQTSARAVASRSPEEASGRPQAPSPLRVGTGATQTPKTSGSRTVAGGGCTGACRLTPLAPPSRRRPAAWSRSRHARGADNPGVASPPVGGGGGAHSDERQGTVNVAAVVSAGWVMEIQCAVAADFVLLNSEWRISKCVAVSFPPD